MPDHTTMSEEIMRFWLEDQKFYKDGWWVKPEPKDKMRICETLPQSWDFSAWANNKTDFLAYGMKQSLVGEKPSCMGKLYDTYLVSSISTYCNETIGPMCSVTKEMVSDCSVGKVDSNAKCVACRATTVSGLTGCFCECEGDHMHQYPEFVRMFKYPTSKMSSVVHRKWSRDDIINVYTQEEYYYDRNCHHQWLMGSVSCTCAFTALCMILLTWSKFTKMGSLISFISEQAEAMPNTHFEMSRFESGLGLGRGRDCSVSPSQNFIELPNGQIGRLFTMGSSDRASNYNAYAPSNIGQNVVPTVQAEVVNATPLPISVSKEAAAGMTEQPR